MAARSPACLTRRARLRAWMGAWLSERAPAGTCRERGKGKRGLTERCACRSLQVGGGQGGPVMLAIAAQCKPVQQRKQAQHFRFSLWPTRHGPGWRGERP